MMNLGFVDLFSLSWNSLRANPLRSGLTALGVFMGVAAVSSTLQVGTISKAAIAQKMAAREAPQVYTYMWSRTRSLRAEDLDYLRSRLEGVQAIGTSAGWWFGDDTVTFEDREASAEVEAVSEEYLMITGRAIVQGRFFNQLDFDSYRPVVVIDTFLADKLFPGRSPLGEQVYFNGRLYVTIGVMETKLRYQEDEPSGEMFMPMTLYTALTGRRSIGTIRLRPYRLEDMKQLQEQVESLLQQRYPDGNFGSGNNADDILEQRETLEMVSRALLAVGAIALLVGGVGIANITLAAVMERTPEIGLRRAIGATRADIMLQFILEAAMLSIAGGVLAIATVHGLTLIVADRFELPYEFESKTAAFALSAALLVGVGAGFVPALQASKLDPVQALRSR